MKTTRWTTGLGLALEFGCSVDHIVANAGEIRIVFRLPRETKKKYFQVILNPMECDQLARDLNYALDTIGV